jgi:WD40 repeat protein
MQIFNIVGQMPSDTTVRIWDNNTGNIVVVWGKPYTSDYFAGREKIPDVMRTLKQSIPGAAFTNLNSQIVPGESTYVVFLPDRYTVTVVYLGSSTSWNSNNVIWVNEDMQSVLEICGFATTNLDMSKIPVMESCSRLIAQSRAVNELTDVIESVALAALAVDADKTDKLNIHLEN